MDSGYSFTVGGICGAAVCCNIMFLFVLIKVPIKAARSCTRLFLVTTVHCWLSAVCCGIIIPRAFVFDFVSVFVAVGPLSQWRFSPWLLVLWSSILMSSFLLVINKFVYRYVQVCKPRMAYIFSSRRWQVIVSFINIALVLKWATLMSYSCYMNQELKEIARSGMLQHFNLEMDSISFIGCSSKNHAAIAVMVESLLTIFVLASVGVYCAAWTYISIKKRLMSQQKKKLHRHMFILLIVESIYSILSLQTPISTIRLLLFIGATSTTVYSYAIGIVLSSFNCFCPSIAILFIRDYRNFFLRMFRLRILR